jgi:16S rRNA (uracil1498-N3)-methyltransferase
LNIHLTPKVQENCQLDQEFLSNIELYFTAVPANNNLIRVEGEEHHHITDVMRNTENDIIYVTHGTGIIYKSAITAINKNEIICEIVEEYNYENKFQNICFCIPRLKAPDRFEFALEKCVELGITNFIVFDSLRTVAKGEKIERWQKILLAAMKQSLRAWLPKISYVKNVSHLIHNNTRLVLFEQNGGITYANFLKSNEESILTDNFNFIFGPEGGFDEKEIKELINCEIVKLTENRLRSETAITTAASVLSLRI